MFDLRYSREIALKEISTEGHERIRGARVCIVGLGATGSPAADLFARAGAGFLKIIDGDRVDISNLHRQILYSEADVGAPKVEAASRRLSSINGSCEVSSVNDFVNSGNIGKILPDCDIIIDGTDNMDTRRLINRYCVENGKPWIFISSIGTVCQVKAVIPHVTSCLDCFVDPGSHYSMSCEETGVLASAPVMASSLAWTLAVRILLGKGVTGDLHYIDPWNGVNETIGININPECITCSQPGENSR